MKLRYRAFNQGYGWYVRGVQIESVYHREDGPTGQSQGIGYSWYLGGCFICNTRIP